jgi:UPF0716 protein FxsA
VIRLLLLAFIVIPIVEMIVIIRVGGILGFWETFALIVVIGIVGAILWKQEGRRTWDAFRDALAEGRWPGDEVTQGALVLFGGALLLTPGFITDAVGLLSVLPPSRAAISRLIRRRVTPGPVREIFRMREASGRRTKTREETLTRDRGTIDVEVVSVERDESGPRPGGRPGDVAGEVTRGDEESSPPASEQDDPSAPPKP